MPTGRKLRASRSSSTTRSDLAKEDVQFTLTPEEITLLNPNTGTCPVFRSRRDAEITLGIYRRVPVLMNENDPVNGNPWGIRFMQGLFNMTSRLAPFPHPRGARGGRLGPQRQRL